MEYGLVTFTSTFGAISAEKLLKEVAPVQVMPVLREISAGCGIAVRFAPEDLEPIHTALVSSPLRPEEYCFYTVTGSGEGLTVAPLSASGI